MRLYAIGDIHGYLGELEAAHERIERDRRDTGDHDALVIHLGDLVDRGPDSRGVIRYLMDGIAAGAPWKVLKGNHDRIFATQIRDGEPEVPMATWTSEPWGGAMTMASYGVDALGWPRREKARRQLAEAVPEADLAFLENLPTVHETPDLILVHAGIRPGLAMSEQIEDDLVWIRKGFLDDPRDHGRLVVHGHTPVDTPFHAGNRIDLDTGAGYGRPLTAAVFEGRDCFVLGPDGREPLLPPD
jgi:serine/threonine protein phosphatase 1